MLAESLVLAELKFNFVMLILSASLIFSASLTFSLSQPRTTLRYLAYYLFLTGATLGVCSFREVVKINVDPRAYLLKTVLTHNDSKR